MAGPQDKLKQLEAIEKDVAAALQSAGQAISELAKDKPSVKQAESHSTQFLKMLESVETGLSKHILYLTQVSTGQAHEGSSYASQKMMQMAWHRLKHSQSRLNELELLKNQHLQQNQQMMRQPQDPIMMNQGQ